MQTPTTFSLYSDTITGKFDPNKSRNRYTVNNIPEQPLSVSTIANMADKSPALMAWQLKTIRSFCTDFLSALQEDAVSKPVVLEMIERALKRPEEEKQEAGNLGEEAHQWFLKFAEFKVERKNKPAPPLPEDETVRKCLNGFLEWYNRNDVKFVETERTVYSKEHNYIGTLDAIAWVNGKLTLIDYKSSKSLYPAFLFQLAGYKQAREEEWIFNAWHRKGRRNKKERITQIMLFQLDKENGEFWEPILIHSPDNLDELWRGFLHALNFKKQEKKARKLLK